MRQAIAGLVAGLAIAAGTVSAQACEYGPCSPGPYGYYYGTHYVDVRERLPDPAGPEYYGGPQYYYVDQGPTYTGPGNWAPVPTYQERAVSGWYAYSQPYYYGYNGGPYANPTSHYYDGVAAADLEGPVIYTYPSTVRSTYIRRHRVAPKYYYTERRVIAPLDAYGMYDAPGPIVRRVSRTIVRTVDAFE